MAGRRGRFWGGILRGLRGDLGVWGCEEDGVCLSWVVMGVCLEGLCFLRLGFDKAFFPGVFFVDGYLEGRRGGDMYLTSLACGCWLFASAVLFFLLV